MSKKILILVLALMMCITGTINAFAVEDKNLDIEVSGKAVGMPAKVWNGELFLQLPGHKAPHWFEPRECLIMPTSFNINNRAIYS